MNSVSALIQLMKSATRLLQVFLLFSVMGGALFSFSYSESLYTADGDYENSTIAAGDWVPPDPPVFWVEENDVDNELNWLAPTDAVEYNVYRSADDITYSLLTNLGAVTTYTDAGVGADIQYYYKVTALDTVGNENPLAVIPGKSAQTKDIVVDDDARVSDLGADGTVTPSAEWQARSVDNVGVNQPSHSNAVGGDHYRIDPAAADPTFIWTAASAVAGDYEVFVSYVCRDNRGTAGYRVYSGATEVTVAEVLVDQSLRSSDGTPCGDQNLIDAQAEWVSLGIFSFADVPEVRLVSQAGGNLRADAVAFHRDGVTTPEALLPDDGVSGNSTDVYIDWTDVTDDFPVVTYDYERTTDPTFTVVDFTDTGLALSETYDNGLPDGTYYWRVRACNGLADCSAYSTVRSFTIDNALPDSITVVNSPEKELENRITNPEFEDGLNNWDSLGEVSVVESYGEAPNQILPHEGNTFAQLEPSVDTQGSSSLTQTIINDGLGIRTISFWYNIPDASVAGEQSLYVYADDVMLFQAEGRVNRQGWQQAIVYVADIGRESFDLTFYTGEETGAVMIDSIRTDETVVNAAATLTVPLNRLRARTAHYEYTMGGRVIADSAEEPLTFSLLGQPDGGVLTYWNEMSNGDKVNERQVTVWYDSVAPNEVRDLVGVESEPGVVQLSFTAPFDGTNGAAREYDIRYSNTPILPDTDWNSLARPEIVNADELPGEVRAPKLGGSAEQILVTGMGAAGDYFVAVKSTDLAGNVSGISNLAAVSTTAGSDSSSLGGEEPSISLIQQDTHNASLGVYDATDYEQVSYTLTYTRDQDGVQVQEGLTGQEVVTGMSVVISDIYLGTQSGDDFSPHEGVDNVVVEVVLSGPGIPDRTLTDTIETWDSGGTQ